MDAFWAGLAVGFGILLFDRMGQEGQASPGLPSYRPGVGPGGQPGSGPYSGYAPPAPSATSGCTTCGPSCGTNPPQSPTAVNLGTPFAPAPTNLPPATPYTGNDQWNAGVGAVPGGGTAAWGVN